MVRRTFDWAPPEPGPYTLNPPPLPPFPAGWGPVVRVDWNDNGILEVYLWKTDGSETAIFWRDSDICSNAFEVEEDEETAVDLNDFGERLFKRLEPAALTVASEAIAAARADIIAALVPGGRSD